MKTDESSEQRPEGDVEAFRTLLEQRYRNALEILRKKLNQAIDLAMVEMQVKQAIEQINLYCSFCGKSQDEVAKLIAGPAVYICNECIGICNEILEDDSKTSDKTKS